MTDLRTEIQSAILNHIHEVRGVAALTDAIMVAVEKHENTLLMHLAYIRQKSGVGMKPMLSELADAIAERIESARADALEEAASGLEKCNTNGLERRICCDGYMCGCHGSTVAEYAAHCVRSMKDKP